jgi:hypothetical protein
LHACHRASLVGVLSEEYADADEAAVPLQLERLQQAGQIESRRSDVQ